MYETHWIAMGVLATLMTFSWLFVSERITVTSFAAFVSWGILSITGGDVERVTSDGTVVQTPVVEEVRYVLFGFALLSLLAFVLYRVGAYPPEHESPYDGEN